ncbi:MAG: AmmeMemoRadiSam system radical SAM enzyme [Bacteroidales bacterium]|jgi:pyruvate formate lyase activating enzyme
MEAAFYTELEDQKVKCLLCPHECIIKPGKTGICKVRKNHNGVLYSDVYGLLSAMHFDPIEKKPLYHYFPGKEIFSIGSLGCNFSCRCCQNFNIAQAGRDDFPGLQEADPSQIMEMIRTNLSNIGVAYTYNEPGVWYEYMIDVAREVRQNGYRNVVVSNGYMNRTPLLKLTECIDAFNIDLKAFDENVYHNFTGGKLSGVLDSLQLIRDQGCHLEITFLAVTGINDDMNQFRSMLKWIGQNLGPDVPLHISRYYPGYKLQNEATSISLLTEMAKAASEILYFVYIGNVSGNDYQDTICPGCKKTVIVRNGYSVRVKNMSAEGKCLTCGYNIAIA